MHSFINCRIIFFAGLLFWTFGLPRAALLAQAAPAPAEQPVEPKVVEPKVVEPKVVEPKVVEPKVAKPEKDEQSPAAKAPTKRNQQRKRRGTPERVVSIQVNGMITPMLEQYVRRSLRRARDRDADVVIVEIDSPGGYLLPSQNLAGLMAEVDWAWTVAYVPRQAFSGAAIMSLGCDEIVLHPTAQFGDAGPIFQDEDAAFRHAPEKLRSALAVQMRELAKLKGRSPALAEAMVDMNLKVFRMRDKQTGEEVLLTDRDLKAVEDPGRWEKIQRIAETGDGRFLTLNGERTVAVGLGDALANNEQQLKDHLGFAGDIQIIKRTKIDLIVIILNNPFITGLLFVIGLIALYVELSAPGIGVGAVTATLCFVVFFWSRFLGGTADWLEVVLFITGLIFLAAEFFVIPGFGIAGVSGLLLLLASVILASQSFVIPRTVRQMSEFRQSVVVAATSGITFAILAVWVSRRIGKIPILNQLTLPPPRPMESVAEGSAPKAGEGKPQQGSHIFPISLGDIGIAESSLRPSGRVAFGDVYVDVITDGTFVEAGTRVRVIDVSGNRVRVRAVA
jgi:membrane-bound serine protease (ClpP class)